MQPEQGGLSYHREHWWLGGLSIQSRMVQGLWGTLACWVAKRRVNTAVYVGVSEHFREHCWIGVQCMSCEIGFLGRVGRPLSKALSHKDTRHAEMSSLARAAGAAVMRFGKETSAFHHQSDGESFPQSWVFYIICCPPLGPQGANSPWCLALGSWSGWTQGPGPCSSPTECNGHWVGRWG